MASVTVPLAMLAAGSRGPTVTKGRQPTWARDLVMGARGLPGWAGLGG